MLYCVRQSAGAEEVCDLRILLLVGKSKEAKLLVDKRIVNRDLKNRP